MLAEGSESWIAASIALTAFTGFFTPYAYIGILVTAILFLFFRDPERSSESYDATDVVSPADGRIFRVQNRKLSIFMGIHNVHVNRSPFDGEVASIRYQKGGRVPAFCKDSDRNERNAITIRTRLGNIIVTQISGAVIRRIVCYVKQNEKVTRGQRIGMIRFGSRVDVTLPPGYSFVVSRGQNVKAGKTVIAKLLVN
ncbi:MAG TPA: phosphatidylserine decarboxylase [Candidatus Acidoferrales bacterium]|nr:phosphatidylserine decarboxylase [Candidatus Acidoferrales bacterium]